MLLKRSRIPFLFVLAGCFLLSVNASENGGALLWEDEFDMAGGTDVGFGITASRRHVVAIGVGQSGSGGETELFVRGYDGATGNLEWQDQTPAASGIITNVVIDDMGRMVFGAGYSPDGPGSNILVRAYNAKTGERLWEDVANKGRDDFPQAIAASHYGVFVVGYGGNTPGSDIDFLVRAYDPRTGNLLWEDQVDKSGTDDVAWAVATEGRVVFVAGSTETSAGRDMIVRAYDAPSGTLVWETAHPGASPAAVALTGNGLYVGGNATSNGITGVFLGAYNRENGTLIWQDGPSETNSGVIRNLTARGSRLFAAGSVNSPPPATGVLVRAYHARTGVLLWEDQSVSVDGHREFATAIDLSNDQLYIAGGSGKDFEFSEFLVRAYNARSGKVVWEDRAHRGPLSAALDIALKGRRLFAAGFKTNLSGTTDLLVRAYLVQ